MQHLQVLPLEHPLFSSLAQLPLTMPSLDFALTWHTNPRKSPVVSFWRPLPPAGALGTGVLRMCLCVST